MHMPAATVAGGLARAPAGNVCLTPSCGGPPAPVPYPTVAQVRNGEKVTKKVYFDKKPVIVLPSKVGRTQGDEAGTQKGVMSGTAGDAIAFRNGSSKVFAEGDAVVVYTAMTAHNGVSANLPAGATHCVPSQQKVFVFP